MTAVPIFFTHDYGGWATVSIDAWNVYGERRFCHTNVGATALVSLRFARDNWQSASQISDTFAFDARRVVWQIA